VLDQALQRFPCQVQPVEIGVAALQLGDDAQRLGIVVEAAIGRQHLVQRILAGMAERRVAEIMHQGHALGEILVDLQGPRQRARHLGHLDRVGQPGAVMIAVGTDEDLGLVLQPPEGGRVDDPVAVALEVGARRARSFKKQPTARGPRIRRVDRAFAATETQGTSVYRHSKSCPKPIDATTLPSYL
jgi:hypothetical protein